MKKNSDMAEVSDIITPCSSHQTHAVYFHYSIFFRRPEYLPHPELFNPLVPLPPENIKNP